jgi:hypothetical protein
MHFRQFSNSSCPNSRDDNFEQQRRGPNATAFKMHDITLNCTKLLPNKIIILLDIFGKTPFHLTAVLTHAGYSKN